MGQALALNFCDHQVKVTAWNLEPDFTRAFIDANPSAPVTGVASLADLIAALPVPRNIILMIKAGPAVDEVLAQIIPLLAPADTIIDGGNAHFDDTRRRATKARAHGLEYVGLGVSGGEQGARFGPSLMFGGSTTAWQQLQKPLLSIAAHSHFGACAVRIGPNGAGHFVKMVHNGIEYADMQLIAEAYDIMRQGHALSNANIAPIFSDWNEGPLRSYLIELTAQVLAKHNDQGSLVDQIVDVAEQKGTGRWAVAAALDLGVPIPTISAAVDARVISSQQNLREATADRVVAPDWTVTKDRMDAAQPTSRRTSPRAPPQLNDIRDGLLVAKICAYAQGLAMIGAASHDYDWNISIADVARTWTGGCIIRADMLVDIVNAYEANPNLDNLILDERFTTQLNTYSPALRTVAGWTALTGLAAPACSASLNWLDGIRRLRLPQNLIQAQRDAFGAHTYRRIDDPDTAVHSDWSS